MSHAAATPNLAGKTAVITGATSGLGLETAVALARAGAHCLLVARNAAKGAAARAEIARRSGSNQLDVISGDLASQAEVRKVAAEILARAPRLDILVNNAGTVSMTRQLTADGIELTFAVNHLAYYLLTRLLLERITASTPARIINVASAMHYRGTLDFADLGFEHGYHVLKAYGRSKLCNVLFTRELARRLQGSGVTVNALHPGGVATNIWNATPRWGRPILAVLKALFMISPARGATHITYLATGPAGRETTGGYFQNDRLTEPSALARDDTMAARLWQESARLVQLDP